MFGGPKTRKKTCNPWWQGSELAIRLWACVNIGVFCQVILGEHKSDKLRGVTI